MFCIEQTIFCFEFLIYVKKKIKEKNIILFHKIKILITKKKKMKKTEIKSETRFINKNAIINFITCLDNF